MAKEQSSAGAYEVRHYAQAACGHAFGPLGLESLLRFCRGLEAKLEAARHAGGPLAVVTPVGDKEYRANAAVLLGAYLVLRHSWSTVNLVARFGEEDAGERFACSWERTARPIDARVMRVCDCWAGVELAVLQGWIDAGVAEDDAKLDVACTQYDDLLSYYDTTWIVPGMLMVGADPTTVAFDPNPSTCSQLFPADDYDKGCISGSTEFVPADDDVANSDCDGISIDTVCKEYRKDFINNCTEKEAASTEKGEKLDFASFMMRSGIGIVVRTNFDDEKGMPGRLSYSDHAFEAYGLAQTNIRVEDRLGSIPRPSDVHRMLEVCVGFMQQKGENAVLVHCKGGFGRSVVLACCLAITRLDVPGSTLLGWVRIARPGAVTTRMQEVFLASLKGRRDVLRYAQVTVTEEDNSGAINPCTGQCTVQ